MDREQSQPGDPRPTERRNLERTFQKYLVPALREKRDAPLHVLSVGIGGFADEVHPILDLFPNSIYRGIDIRGDYIEAVRILHADESRASFEVADATDIQTFTQEPLDVIIIRNPQVGGSIRDAGGTTSIKRDWRTIIDNAKHALEQSGVLYISTDNAFERNLVSQYIRADNAMEILVDEENGGRTLQGAFSDRFILIARKKEIA